MRKRGNAGSLGTEKIGRLLIDYSLPAIIATAAASLYHIIDRIFIGHGVGPLAISGLALTFPLMNILAAFGSLVGSGAAVLVSIRLGQNDRKGATSVLGNALMLNLILSSSTSVLGLFFLDPLLLLFGASTDTLGYAREFMQVILAGNVITHLYLGLNNVMRSSGYPQKAMITTLLTVVANLLLAPLFIFGFDWGIRGAALATVFAQVIGTFWVMGHFIRKTSFVRFLPGYFSLQRHIVKGIFSVGLPNFLMLTCASLVIMIMNLSLKNYGGDYAIGAYGIISSIGNLMAMVVLGFNMGMQPISGYNFGAGNKERVLRVFKLTLVAATSVSLACFLAGEIFPQQIALAFTQNDRLVELSTRGMRLSFLMFPLVGFQMVTSSFFQSVGKARLAIVMTLSRQVLLLIPALLVLPGFFGLTGVWLSGPVSDFVSALLAFILLRKQIQLLANA